MVKEWIPPGGFRADIEYNLLRSERLRGRVIREALQGQRTPPELQGRAELIPHAYIIGYVGLDFTEDGKKEYALYPEGAFTIEDNLVSGGFDTVPADTFTEVPLPGDVLLKFSVGTVYGGQVGYSLVKDPR
jgi:hypothetical protein